MVLSSCKYDSSGCSSLAFSSSGFYLAVASVGIDAFPLRIYDTVTGARISSLEVHQDFIHDVTWSPDERYHPHSLSLDALFICRFIVTSSSDGAARVFDVFQEAVNMPVLEKTFQHPCPCYYSQFVCPPNENRPQFVFGYCLLPEYQFLGGLYRAPWIRLFVYGRSLQRQKI